MLASMTGTARQTLMGYLMPQDEDKAETLTEDQITEIVKGFKKPEKNKKKEQLKNDLDGNTQVFITTFLSMVYKAFDRETKLLLVVTQSSEGMTELKVTRNDVERPILLYNFCHSRFQNAAESVGKLISGKTFKHTLFIVDPPWGSTKDYEKPEWDHESKKWEENDYRDVLKFVSMVNPNLEFQRATIIFHVPDNYLTDLLSTIRAVNLHYTVFCWAKNCGNLQGNRIRWAHELAVVVSKRKSTVRPETLYNKDFPDR